MFGRARIDSCFEFEFTSSIFVCFDSSCVPGTVSDIFCELAAIATAIALVCCLLGFVDVSLIRFTGFSLSVCTALLLLVPVMFSRVGSNVLVLAAALCSTSLRRSWLDGSAGDVLP